MEFDEAIRIMDLFVKNIAVENVKVFELKDACKVALQELEHLQKENEEYSKQLDLDYVDENFISKDKIREKIKNEKTVVETCYGRIKYQEGRIASLEDLLKEEWVYGKSFNSIRSVF